MLEQPDVGSGGAEGSQFHKLGLGKGGKFMPGKDTAKKVDFRFCEVVRASNAAPTFFPGPLLVFTLVCSDLKPAGGIPSTDLWP